MTVILAVDPGKYGAFAIITDLMVTVDDLPLVGEGTGEAINDAALAQTIRTYSPDRAFIEEVHAVHGSAAGATFRFGQAFGTILGIIGTLGIPRKLVKPKDWQRFHGIKANDGELSRAYAVNLMPGLALHLARKKDHNRAEAVLIGLYGRAKLREVA